MSSPGNYRVLVGLSYPGVDGKEKRAEVGDEVSDIPKDAIAGLIDQGCIEPADAAVKE